MIYFDVFNEDFDDVFHVVYGMGTHCRIFKQNSARWIIDNS